MLDTDGIPEEFFVKVDLEKDQQMTKRMKNSPGEELKKAFVHMR